MKIWQFIISIAYLNAMETSIDQEWLDNLLINKGFIKELEKNDKIISFSDQTYNTESLKDFAEACNNLNIESIIGRKGDEVSFVIPLTNGVKKLKSLIINGELSSAPVLRNKNLYISCLGLSSVTFPKTMEKLNKLKIKKTSIESLTLPESMNSLKELRLDNNKLISITMPESMNSLKELRLDNNKLISITLPNHMNNLKKLLLGNNLLESIALPEGINELELLYLSKNKLKSLILPENMEKLSYLRLKRNELTSITIPKNIKNLERIDARLNPHINKESNWFIDLKNRFGLCFKYDLPPISPFTLDNAIEKNKKIFTDAYENLATSIETAKLIEENLPPLATVNNTFNSATADLLSLLDQTTPQNFKINQAIKAIKLLQGDESIEHHIASNTKSYSTYSYSYLPNIRQLFVLDYNLLSIDQVDPKSFVTGYLSNTQVWNYANTEFKEKFFKGKAIKIGNTLGETLAQGENNLVDVMTLLTKREDPLPEGLSLAMFKTVHQILPKRIQEAKLEKFTPLIEALFMIMRGHNTDLFNINITKPNEPACAEGAYLNIMKVLAEIPLTQAAMQNIANVEVINCG